MLTSLPLYGTALILATMVLAGYTFFISVLAGSRNSVRDLQAARLGAYGTVALIVTTVLLLAYAFVSHDFRIRYVAAHSDRSMPTYYLLTALWGGQDGSLLWWMFLLSVYIAACVKSLGTRVARLQPYIIATLMVVVMFFTVLMTFSANPFSTSISGARADGDGINPLLQNFYMIIHPPSLYIGFVGCTIPFAYAIAALVTGRLGIEWIAASRRFALFAWLFLGIGNALGMLWAYEELGWGGYWAWDPVENAAFMPFLSMSAFLHSVMIQERRGLFKVWNVALICITFFMTILGTFLTRSGLIASVHAFAQSSIGTYFLYFLGIIASVTVSLILYRWPELRDLPPSTKLRRAALLGGWTIIGITAPTFFLMSRNVGLDPIKAVATTSALCAFSVYAGVELVYRRLTRELALVSRLPRIDSFLSREFTFMLNNWGLLSIMGIILILTLFPKISEITTGDTQSFTPPAYNTLIQPVALLVFFLMGAGTLFGWSKTSESSLKKAWRLPLIVTGSVVVLHLVLGSKFGYPAIVWAPPIWDTAFGRAMRVYNAITPLLGVGLFAFNAAVIGQEFNSLFRARRNAKTESTTPKVLWYAGILPGFFYTLTELSLAGRRRYGGYVVHFGIALIMLGFTGKSWTIDRETTLSPGQSVQVDAYELTYKGPRMEVDTSKRMVFADLSVAKNGKHVGNVSPAKFIYKKSPDSPTTEVAMLHSIADDLYVVIGNVNAQTKIASLQIHINPLVGWIWFGFLVLIMGSFVCMWPEPLAEEARAWRFVRGFAGATASIVFGVMLATLPHHTAFAQTPESAGSKMGVALDHTGTIHIDNETENEIFRSLKCMCGGCPKEPLSSCACGNAEDMRNTLREKIRAGKTRATILAEYEAEFGKIAVIPADSWANRSIYLLPFVAIAGSAAFVVKFMKRGTKSGPGANTITPTDTKDGASPQDNTRESAKFEKALDDELKDLDK
ncbi:MAG: cytochrome c biogenesis protein CcsA [Polyangiaceae bacterium]|nr:cytochrome c biogenesis protein CcsA [Polyangiaceae bacterium]